GWFVAGAVMVLLAVVGGMVYMVTRPPPADQLFQRAEKLMASKSLDDWITARDGPIKTYQRYYAAAHAQSTRVQEWADQVHAALRERQLLNRLKLQVTSADEDESAARAALHAEESGELTVALAPWPALD